MNTLPEDILAPTISPPTGRGFATLFGLDPGWVLGEQTAPGPFDPIRLVAESPWWHGGGLSGPITESFQRLWRHSVAVSIAARSLAKEAGDAEPERLIRAGLLHGLARWAVAAVDPEWMVGWLGEKDPRRPEAPGGQRPGLRILGTGPAARLAIGMRAPRDRRRMAS